MREAPIHLDRLLDVARLRARLSTITAPDAPAGRAEALALFKAAHREGLAAAESMLRDDGSGRACVRRISAFTDAIIRILHDFALARVFRVENLSRAERMAVCAVGGYGRGMLSPRSDLDLLFLLPAKQTALGESVTEYMLYMLWDMGLTVGHATRDVAECIRQARADMTVRTALLESRRLTGDVALHEALVERYERQVMAGTAHEFIAAKLAERDARHQAAGRSRYLVEPNVKEGKGGLRDLQTLYWIGKYYLAARDVDELVRRGAVSPAELRRFRRAQSFLWAVRSHMHFETGREQDVLHFDLQPRVAERLGYTARPGLSAVERFMKHYFLTVREVGDLTRIVCAELEEAEAKEAPRVGGVELGRIGVGPVNLATIGLGAAVRAVTHRRQAIAGTQDFVARRGRIDRVSEAGSASGAGSEGGEPDLFQRRPAAMLEMFAVAEREGLLFHPDAMHAVRRALPHVTREVRRDPAAVEAFMAVLTSPREPETYLRKMSDCGLLGRFVPEFGRVIAMMQFSMYHHYTVDEHLLFAVGAFSRLEKGWLEADHPLVTGFTGTLDRTVMFVALLLHDIAKGRDEDHSVAGARIARRVCARLGLSAERTELVSWLIAEHLTMSNTAQTRDLSDFGTIRDFADRVQSVERLRHLLALTVCDIRAVGPGVWNGWKGQLLRTLYHEAEPHLTGGFVARPIAARARERREALVEAVTAPADGEPALSGREAVRVAALHHPSYLLSTSAADQLRHARLIADADAQGRTLTTDVAVRGPECVTEITVLAPDHPHLLSTIAGACAAADANIVAARVATTSDGRALDSVLIACAFDDAADEMRRAERITRTVVQVLAGEARVPQLVAERAAGAHRRGRRAKPFAVAPRVRIDNDLSNVFTVVEIEGADRPGLLSEITAVLAAANLDIGSAQVTTFGEKIVDSFYVRDLVGAKITSADRLDTLRARLLALFETRGPAKAPAPEPSKAPEAA